MLDHATLPYVVGLTATLTFSISAFLTMRQFLPCRQGRGWQIILAIAAWMCSSTIVFVGDPVNILGILPVLPLSFLLVGVGSVHGRLSLALVFYCLFIGLNGTLDTLFNYDVFGILIRAAFWGIALVASRYFVKQPPVLAGRLWAVVNVLTIMPLAAIFIVVLPNGDTYDRISVLGEAGILLLACIASSALLAAIVVFSHHQRLAEEAELHRMQTGYYRQLEEAQAALRHLRHDMANHLGVLAGLPPAQVQPYIEQLLEGPAMNQDTRYCENPVVGAVLAAKAGMLRGLGCVPDIQVSLPAETPFAAPDLCALLANALDNAIEALQQLPQEQRSLYLRFGERKGQLVLVVKNPAKEPQRKKDGGFASSKQDKTAHGLGLKSIAAVARRYGGVLDAHYHNGSFSLTAAIPLQ